MKISKISSWILPLLFIMCFTHANATIIRVNNNPGITGLPTTLQAGHNAANAGDTIHLEGSPNGYGNLTCTKRLIILGPGYFLGENPNTQAIALFAGVGTVTFNIGSEGSVIMGCDFGGNSCNVFASNIVIRRNKFSSPSGNNIDWSTGNINLYYQSNNSGISIDNIIISQNFGISIGATSRAVTGLLISNNYIGWNGYGGDATTNPSLNLHENTIAIIQNNLFRRGRINASNSSFTNNIMMFGSIAGTGNLFANNLANNEQFGTTNGNRGNIDMSTVFLGSGSGISADGAWMLKTGSPAIGAGFGSTAGNVIDAGMFGGSFPYVLSGMPPIPSVYFFENQPVGSNTDPIDVSLKVKSHN